MIDARKFVRRSLFPLVTAALLAATTMVSAQTRPVVGGTHGMVASNHPQASFAGIEMLMQGGNAVDAAIATAAALGVVEPYLSGLGGDGFMLIYDAETEEINFLNFNARSPGQLSVENFAEQLERNDGRIDRRGPLNSLIPGAAAGWAAAQERYGTLDAATLLEPSIRMARNGYPATAFAVGQHSNAMSIFLDWDEAGANAWWDGEVRPPQVGDLIYNTRLADTYEIMAENGFMSFYDSSITEEIVRFNNLHGGVFTLEDFQGLEATWHEPLTTNYRGYDIYTPRPNSSGGLAIPQILNVLEGYDLVAMGENSAEYIHVMAEAIKLAAADRTEWSGDPEFMENEIPYDVLLSKEYADERRALIDLEQASGEFPAGVEQPGTSHITVVDSAGNMVAMTVTLGSGWGSGFIAGETGVVLNDAINWFEFDETSPAYIEPGKRTRWNMSPTIIVRDGEPFAALGTPGGTGIWQTLPQVITKLIDFELDIQSAIESPRFVWTLSTTTIRPEARMADAFEQLEAWGHTVNPHPEWTSSVGGVNGIVVNRETGVLLGGADPRRDGYVIGW